MTADVMNIAGGLEITAARPADARALAALRTAVAEHMTERHGEGQWSGGTSRAEVLRSLRASQVLVARQGPYVVGTVRLATVSPHVVDYAGFTRVSSALYLLGLAVAPEYRRMGIGRALMEAAKDAARARRVEALWLDTHVGQVGAGAFYLRCGFRRVRPTGQRKMPIEYYEWLVD